MAPVAKAKEKNASPWAVNHEPPHEEKNPLQQEHGLSDP